jgi:ribonuclease P protein component
MRKGRRLQADSIRCVFIPNALGHARLGLAVSRKYGSAVQRNRFKRQIRNTFRQHPIRDAGIDVLIVPLASATGMATPSAAAQELFTELMQRLSRS